MTIYRLRLTYSYSTQANAITATDALNTILAGWADPVLSQRVVRTGSSLELKIPGLTESQGLALRSAMWTAAHAAARSGGKFSLVRSPDLS